jgi:GNAT superfamily N-acetyltransferase
MIRRLQETDFKSILRIINDSSEAYKGVIPEDRWKKPYMSDEELRKEIEDGVEFYGWMEDDILMAIMGIQQVKDITLFRHAYVHPNRQRRGIGEKMLKHLMSLARTSVILVGTWEAAYWAIRFYEKHGFKLVSRKEKDMLLRKYWNIPDRQIETSVVLKLNR